MKRLLFVFVLFWVIPVFADVMCPAGYQLSGYIELEYIESTGGQYIDTGFVPNQDSRVVTKIKLNNVDDNLALIFGAGATYSSRTFELFAWGGKLQFDYGNGYTIGSSVAVGDVIDIDFNKNVLNYSINGVEQTQIVRPYINFTTPHTLTLFAIHRNLPTRSLLSFYMTKIYDNGVLLRDFIPVRRLSDGVIGMYDVVSRKFFGNFGTGEFTAGPELPSFFADENNIACAPCPPNTYKPSAGNENCTKCPDGRFSPSGATSINECGRILHIGDYVAHMPFGRRTEHGLCTMLDGKKYCADVYEKQ